MLAAITDPNGLAAGLERARTEQGLAIGAVVAAPPGVDPRTRLNIYAEGYWLRLLACLHADYPALLRLLGEPLFEFFARGYLHHHPSTSPSLYDLGAAFPRFLRRSQTGGPAARHRFPLELAALERAFTEALRSPGLEDEPPPVPLDPTLLLAGQSGTVGLPATTRLVALSHPLSAFRPWLAGESPPGLPETGRDYAAVRRHRHHVTWERLADWQFFALRHAARQPRPRLDCARAAARRTGRPLPEVQALLAFWLPAAQAGSLVALAAAGA